MIYLEILAGLLLLVGGGDALVRGAATLARRLGVSPLMIGLTLVGFGTSTPELLTSVHAALIGSPGIAVGNVIGSNTANILLILGLAALIQPLATSREMLRRDGGVMLLAALICLTVVLRGRLSPDAGLVLIALLIAYITYAYLRERQPTAALADRGGGEGSPPPGRLWLALGLMAGGLLLTLLGARLLVDATIELARSAGVSETLLGLTLVAVGTSLPELVTSVVAAWRRHGDIALGNILGSNIYNVFGILGLTAVLQPIAVPEEIVRLDIWVMLAATLALLVFGASGRRVTRLEGGLLLSGYLAYLLVLLRAV